MTAGEKMQARVACAAARAVSSRVRGAVKDAGLTHLGGVHGHLSRLLVEMCLALEELAGAVDAMITPRAKPLGRLHVRQARRAGGMR